MIGFYSVLLSVVLCWTISEAKDIKENGPLFGNLSRLRGLFTGCEKSHVFGKVGLKGFISEFPLEDSINFYSKIGLFKLAINSNCELFRFLPELLWDENKSGKIENIAKIVGDKSGRVPSIIANALLVGEGGCEVQTMKEDFYWNPRVKTLRPRVMCLLAEENIDLLKSDDESIIQKNEKMIKSYSGSGPPNATLEKALIISIYVMSRFPQDLSGAFKCVEKLKRKSDDRVYNERMVGANDADYIELKDEDCKVIYPLLGELVGAKKQVRGDGSVEILDDRELAELAGDKSGKFIGRLQKFVRGIKPIQLHKQ